jgi:hypothetical protein|tara:strand:+ start:255 stop:530 length:276 start_codon:yes stop_codon:yes gene_type:complete
MNNTGTTKNYQLPPFPRLQSAKVLEVSPQPQDTTIPPDYFSKGVKMSIERTRRIRPKYLGKNQLLKQFTGGVLNELPDTIMNFTGTTRRNG